MGIPGNLEVQSPLASAGDTGSIPDLGRFPRLRETKPIESFFFQWLLIYKERHIFVLLTGMSLRKLFWIKNNHISHFLLSQLDFLPKTLAIRCDITAWSFIFRKRSQISGSSLWGNELGIINKRRDIEQTQHACVHHFMRNLHLYAYQQWKRGCKIMDGRMSETIAWQQ